MGFFNLLCLIPPEKILRIFFNTPHQYNKLAMVEIHWNVSQVLPTNSNPTCFSCNFPSSVSDSSSTQRAQGSSPWLLSFLGPISKPSRTIPPLRHFSNLHSGYTGVPTSSLLGACTVACISFSSSHSRNHSTHFPFSRHRNVLKT